MEAGSKCDNNRCWMVTWISEKKRGREKKIMSSALMLLRQCCCWVCVSDSSNIGERSFVVAFIAKWYEFSWSPPPSSEMCSTIQFTATFLQCVLLLCKFFYFFFFSRTISAVFCVVVQNTVLESRDERKIIEVAQLALICLYIIYCNASMELNSVSVFTRSRASRACGIQF